MTEDGRTCPGRGLPSGRRRLTGALAVPLLVLCWFQATAPVMAQPRFKAVKQDAPPAEFDQPIVIELEGDELLAATLITRFLKGHPDLFWRLRGRTHYGAGNFESARRCFERGARYADKPSQAMLGEMHWLGLGGPVDRALGYAWMDLAAERLYEDFYIKRERYWAKLDAAQRKDALRRGQPLLRRYGDDRAKPRLARILRRERPQVLPVSGFFGNLPIIPPSPGAPEDSITLRGSEYFDDTFWDPDAYFAWQDTIWKTLHDTGRVEVGDPDTVQAPATE